MFDQIRTHLADNAPSLIAVEVVESVEALAEMTQRDTGTAFVVPYRERAKPNQLSTGGHRQEVQTQVVVAFLVRSYADASGAARAVQFDKFKTEIEAVLAGWQPSFVTTAFELVGGESSTLERGVSLYAQTWETTRFLTGDTT